MITSTLAQLQSAIASMLMADSALSGSQSINGKPVPIVTEQIGDVISYTQKAIGEMGLVAVVLTPDFKLLDYRVIPLVAIVRIQIQVSEFFAINQSSTGIGISAQTLAARICFLLHWKTHNVVANLDPKQQLIQFMGATLRSSKDQRDTLTYLLMFQTHLVIKTL